MTAFNESYFEERYFGPDGAVLTLEEWADLFERRTGDMSKDSWWRRQTTVDDVEVSTVWLGLNHAFGFGPPLYWETMIFYPATSKFADDQWRYSSRAAALDDHERIVRALRAGEDPSADDSVGSDE